MSKKTFTNSYITHAGFLSAFMAYFVWGMFPLYMMAVSHVSVLEVLAHRIIWALPTALVIIIFLGRTSDLVKALTNKKTLSMACLTSILISTNWGGYIWAVGNNHAIDASLGYFINPLFSTMLGVVFLRERLNLLQWISVGLAVVAVGLMAIYAGGLPWISILLPVSFGLYGFFRKSLPIGPVQGFTLETIILFIPALFLLIFMYKIGVAHFAVTSLRDTVLLMFAGPLTAIPLILFAFGAKKLNLITTGLMQYIVPTALFLIAVFIFKEPFSQMQLLAFLILWLGLIIFTFSTLWNFKQQKPKTLKV